MINQIKTVVLLGLLSGLMLGVGILLGGKIGLTIALILAILMNFLSYFFSHKIVLMMYRAVEAPKSKYQKLHNIIEDIAKRAGLPKPKVYIIPSKASNAFCTGRVPNNYVVAVTEGIMSLLDEKELRGVIAHEIAHAKNKDVLIATIAATIATVISYVASMARFATLFGSRDRDNNLGNVLSVLVLAILAPIIALIIQLAISRSREYMADKSGAHFIKDSEPLARALSKLEIESKNRPLEFGNPTTASLFIVKPFSGKTLVNLFSTHPPLKERIERLRSIKF